VFSRRTTSTLRVVQEFLCPRMADHQFNLRIDPAIDGHENTLSYVDSLPMPQDLRLNPYGTGYITQETKITKSSNAQTDPFKNRIFKISNPAKINPVSLAPVAYKLVPISSQPLLASKDSWHYRRSEFCDAPIWVQSTRTESCSRLVTTPTSRPVERVSEAGSRGTKTSRTRTLSCGTRTRSRTTPDLRTSPLCVSQRVTDLQFAMLMSAAESVRIALKPVGFFNYNPTMDVPPSTQAFNNSKSYDPTLQVGADSQEGVQSITDGVKGLRSAEGGSSCCAKL